MQFNINDRDEDHLRRQTLSPEQVNNILLPSDELITPSRVFNGQSVTGSSIRGSSIRSKKKNYFIDHDFQNLSNIWSAEQMDTQIDLDNVEWIRVNKIPTLSDDEGNNHLF